jgi:hypothetical protein
MHKSMGIAGFPISILLKERADVPLPSLQGKLYL